MIVLVPQFTQFYLLFNPLNATGANAHQVPMLSDNYGIERVKVHIASTVTGAKSSYISHVRALTAQHKCPQ